MNRDQVNRRDFPESSTGYDRPSVDAHLDAVAATLTALEAQVKAVEVERDALRRNASNQPPQGGSSSRPSVAAAPPVVAPSPPAAVPDPPAEVPAPTPLRAVADEPTADVTPVTDVAADEPDPEPVDEVVAVADSAAPAGAAPEGASNSADESSARLVAMKMALDGAAREEIRTKLDAEYELNDVEALLDDVFKRVG